MRRSLTILIALAALLGVGVGWFAMRETSSSKPAQAAVADATTLEIATAGEPAHSSASSDSERRELDVVDPAVDANPSAKTETHSIDIDVVDGVGQGTEGARVVLLAFDEDDDEWSAPWSGVTDAKGRAALANLDDVLKGFEGRLMLGLALARGEPEQVEFTTATLPREPVRFVIEPTGSVEVSLCDASGDALAIDSELRLEIEVFKTLGLPLPMRAGRMQDSPSREGRAVFERVALDMPLIVSAWARGFGFREHELIGPTRAGERILARVQLVEVCPLVQGRVLDADGEPLANWNLRVAEQRADGAGQDRFLETQTNEAGEFRHFLWNFKPDHDYGELRLRAEHSGVLPGVARMRCPAPVTEPGNPPRLVIDFGDIRIEREPFVVSGRVLDARGEPVEGAGIMIRELAPSIGESNFDTGAETDSEGRFTVGDRAAWSRLELRAGARHFANSDPVAASAGSTDVVLVLRDTGGFDGHLLLPARFDAHRIDIRFAGVDEHSGVAVRVSGYERGDSGFFAWHDIAPGHYSIHVEFDETTLAERNDIVVRANETTHVEPIDLREIVHALQLELVDERGARILDGWVLSYDEESWNISAGTEPDGLIVFPSLSPIADVVANSPGFRTQRFENVHSGDRLALARAIPVRLLWPADVARVTAPLLARVRLEHVEGDLLSSYARDTTTELAASGSAEAQLPLSGKYSIELVLVHSATHSEFKVEAKAPQTIEVSGDGQTPEIVLAIDSIALQDARRKAERD